MTKNLDRILIRCTRCKQTMQRQHFNFHKTTCLCVRGCGMRLPHETLLAHENECPLAIVTCPGVRYGCTERLQRNQMGEHAKNCLFEAARIVLGPIHEKLDQSVLDIQSIEREMDSVLNEADSYLELQENVHNGVVRLREDLKVENNQLRLISSMIRSQLATFDQESIQEPSYPMPEIPFDIERTRFSCIIGSRDQLYIYKDGVLIDQFCCLQDQEIELLVALNNPNEFIVMPYNSDSFSVWIYPKEQKHIFYFDGETIRCIYSIKGESEAEAPYINSQHIIIGTSRSLKLFDLEGRKTIYSVTEPSSAVIILNNGDIMLGNDDGMLFVYDINGTRKRQFKDKGAINCMDQLPNGMVVVGTDKCVSIWSTKGRRMHTLESHTEPVIFVMSHLYGIISGSLDGTLRTYTHGSKEKSVIPAPGFAGTILDFDKRYNITIAIPCGDKCYIWSLVHNKFVSMFSLEEPATTMLEIHAPV